MCNRMTPPSNDYTSIEMAVSQRPKVFEKTVSVIIPHFNARTLLERCLFGLVSQSYPLYLMEAVVSDDGSPSELYGLHEMFGKYLNLKVLTHERKGYRLSTVRNRGILSSEGEVIICLDCDVIPVPELIEAHLQWFHLSDEVATIGPRKFIDATGIRPSDVPRLMPQLRRYSDVPSVSNRYQAKDNRWQQFQNFKQHTHPYNCFHGCNVGFRRASTLTAGLFDEDFNGRYGYEDIEFGYRLYRAGYYLVFEERALGLHQENALISAEQRTIDGKVNRLKLYKKVPSLEQYRREIGGR